MVTFTALSTVNVNIVLSDRFIYHALTLELVFIYEPDIAGLAASVIETLDG